MSIEELTIKKDDLQAKVAALRTSCEGLLETEDESQLEKCATESGYKIPDLKLEERKLLKGHFGKIYAMDWSAASRSVVSASQDGKLIVWNAFTTNKMQAIALRSSWVMTCGFSGDDELVACGGLDNLCSIYRVNANGDAPTTTYKELAQHEGYLSCSRFIGNDKLVTSSGDQTCIYWDVESKNAITTFDHHTGDVMSVSIAGNNSVFASGSCDATVKLNDIRTGGLVGTFTGHESDINSVSMFPNDKAVATGSDDSTCRFFDQRSYRQVAIYQNDKILCGITSVALGFNGETLFAGYDDYNCICWSSLAEKQITSIDGHENRISCLGVGAGGGALCTGSWDTTLKVWA